MIPCPNCKSLNKEGSTVCEFCGASLITNNQSNHNTNANPTPNNMNNNQNIGIQTQFNNQYQADQAQNDEYDHKDLVSHYVVKNYYKFLSGFSWCTLFLQGFYIWYRKMYALLGIWFLINLSIGLICYHFSKIKYLPIILVLVVSIIIAANFKSMYMKHVRKKVDKIIEKNRGQTQDELERICTKKGGTNALPIVLLVLMCIPLLIMGVPVAINFLQGLGGGKVNQQHAQIYVDKAQFAISDVKQDVRINQLSDGDMCTGEPCIYNLEKINSLLELKLGMSSFGNQITNACIWVTKGSGTGYGSEAYNYEMCMIDSKGIGFNKTSDKTLSKEDVKSSGISCYCG